MSIAALPMYDLEELRDATDALWAAIAGRLEEQGIAAPESLTRGPALEDLWTDPDLLLAQTCGLPLVTVLRGRVVMVATPCYRAAGCEGASYRSAVIVREADAAGTLADLHGRRCAVNGSGSNSGMNLLRAAIAPVAGGAARFFGAVVMTGGHAASVRAVADGRADVAAIDCVTWALLQRVRPAATRGLRVLAWTTSNPGLPLITSVRTGEAACRALVAALHAVAQDSALAPVRATLLLERFEVLPLRAYDAVLALETQAAAAGYPMLR